MALIRYDPSICSVHGRVGDGDDALVYYRVGEQDIARRRGASVDPHTAIQQAHRRIRTTLVRRYSALPPEPMEAWRRLARSLDANPPGNESRARNGIQVYVAVNTHRCLAGFEPTDVPPDESGRILAQAPGVHMAALADGRLRLTLEHSVAAGAGFWRIRLSPSLGRGGRSAQPNALRLATLEPALSYVVIAASPQRIDCQPRYAYRAGENLGLDILALSSGFIPGLRLLLLRMPIAADSGDDP